MLEIAQELQNMPNSRTRRSDSLASDPLGAAHPRRAAADPSANPFAAHPRRAAADPSANPFAAHPRRAIRPTHLLASLLMAVLSLAACGPTSAAATAGRIPAVGAENEYANVISQIGGRYVSVSAIMSNPNTDPHTFEASPSVAEVVSGARLVVQNGLGYDTFMNKIEAASPNSQRQVITVQSLLGLPDSTPNPHLWYKPGTMPAVAAAVEKDLAEDQPAHRSYFAANLARFDDSLSAWTSALSEFASRHPNTPVAVTEPVADYMLQAAGCDIMTPFPLQAAIMNGTDPSPEDVSVEQNLLADHKVAVFLYNQQVTDPLTASFLALAKRAGVPVVGVYETMPTPGYDYQTWMMAELQALRKAVTGHISTRRL